MKLKRFLALVLVLLITLNLQPFHETNAMEQTEEIVYSLPVGSSTTRAANIINYGVYEYGFSGPQSFWVGENGTIYLLDTEACQIVEIGQNEVKYVTLQEALSPIDIVVYNGEYYIYDEWDEELQIYNKNGELQFKDVIPHADNYVKCLNLGAFGVVVETYGTSNLVLTNRVEKSWSWIEKENVELYINPEYDFVNYLGKDMTGNTYTLNNKAVKNTCVIAGEMSVHGMSLLGNELGSYIINRDEFVYLPKYFLRLTEDGSIYMMVPTEQALEIRRIILTENPVSRYDEIEEEALQLEAELQAEMFQTNVTRNTTALPLTRTEVSNRANAMIDYEWTLTQDNVDLDGNTDRRLAKWITDIADLHEGETSWSETVKGIPYCWGGFFSQYSGYGGLTFSEAIEAGYLAGNILCTGNYKPRTAGLDCSGFASAAYGLSSRRCSHDDNGEDDFYHYGTLVNAYNELSPMDFIVKDGHVMLFAGNIDAASKTMLVYETTKSGQKIKRTTYNEAYLEGEGYIYRTPW